MLSVLLRPTYPNLRCLAFSPPGCVFSANLADECSRWLTTYVLDDDVVPRLSIESVEDLRNSVLEMICRIKIPKYQVQQHWRKDTDNRESLAEANAEILYEKEMVKDSAFKQQLDKFLQFQIELKEKNKSTYIQLFPPGRIIQLFRTEDGKGSLHNLLPTKVTKHSPKGTEQYTARWAERSDLQSVNLSSHLLSDHDPIKVKNKLEDLASRFGLSPPYSNVLPDEV
jgi:hypothetical protein